MDLNQILLQDERALATWVRARLAARAAAGAALQAAQGRLSPGKQALQQGVEAALDGIVDEAIGKLPGGGLALEVGGRLLKVLIVKLVQRGFAEIPGWLPPPLPPMPAPAPEPGVAPVLSASDLRTQTTQGTAPK